MTKGVAIFRSSHLFLTYSTPSGDRGRFIAFGRNEKRRLYIKGGRFINYNAERGNFLGRFTRNRGIIDEIEYNTKKQAHLEQAQKVVDRGDKRRQIKFIKYAVFMQKLGWNYKQIAEMLEVTSDTISKYIKMSKEDGFYEKVIPSEQNFEKILKK